MERSNLEVEVEPEFDVDVRETLEKELIRRGIDASISTYQQPMIVATTRRRVAPNTYQTFKIRMKANKITTQEQLCKEVEEKVDNFFDMSGIKE